MASEAACDVIRRYPVIHLALVDGGVKRWRSPATGGRVLRLGQEAFVGAEAAEVSSDAVLHVFTHRHFAPTPFDTVNGGSAYHYYCCYKVERGALDPLFHLYLWVVAAPFSSSVEGSAQTSKKKEKKIGWLAG